MFQAHNRAAAYLLFCFIGSFFGSACGPLGLTSNDGRKGGDPQLAPPPPDGPLPVAPNPLDQSMDLGFAANATVTNLQDLVTAINLGPYHARGFKGQGLKVAILDNGFTGLNISLGQRLPPDTVIPRMPGNNPDDTTHGLKLAELVYALATGQPRYNPAIVGPKMYLMCTNGFTNFSAAVNLAIQEKVDIILYSQIWEYGGNLDGQGFIDLEANRAVAAGILWVNASGNYGQSSYFGAVRASSNQRDVVLPYLGKYVRFTVPSNDTPAKIVLAWNDFADDKNYRTNQDLNLYLEDSNGNAVANSVWIQDGKPHDNSTKYSAHAREMISTNLNAGTYRLRVETASRNFNDSSRLRLTVDGDGVIMLDRSAIQSVLMPADSPMVLTVGANDDYNSSRSIGMQNNAKPEVLSPSFLKFDSGESVKGTSSAAAVAAGGLVALTTAYGHLTKDQVVTIIRAGQGLPPRGSPPQGVKFVLPNL